MTGRLGSACETTMYKMTTENDCIAQGILLITLVTWMGRRCKEEGIYVYTQLIHFAVQQELIQHWKATMLQLKKKDELRYIKSSKSIFKIVRVYSSKNLFESGSAKPEVVRSPPWIGAGERLLWRKGRSKEMMGCL